jgi:hypothetical protein
MVSSYQAALIRGALLAVAGKSDELNLLVPRGVHSKAIRPPGAVRRSEGSDDRPRHGGGADGLLEAIGVLLMRTMVIVVALLALAGLVTMGNAEDAKDKPKHTI